MRMSLQPAHALVPPAAETDDQPLWWWLGEPATTTDADHPEDWYLLFESGPVVIGVRLAPEAEA